MPMYQLDVKNVFLHRDIQEIYLQQPPGFAIRGRE